MLIKPSNDCYAYLEVGPQDLLEIRKVGDNLQPVLRTGKKEQVISLHNLPKIKPEDDLARVISKLSTSSIRVHQSLSGWSVAYQPQHVEAKGYYPLLIPRHHIESAHAQNEPCSQKVEEGGAAADTASSFGNGRSLNAPHNVRVNFSPSPVSDRASLFSSEKKELSAASAVSLVVNQSAAAQQSEVSSFPQDRTPNVENTAIRIASIFESYATRLESRLNRLETNLRTDIARIIADSEMRARAEREKEFSDLSTEFEQKMSRLLQAAEEKHAHDMGNLQEQIAPFIKFISEQSKESKPSDEFNRRLSHLEKSVDQFNEDLQKISVGFLEILAIQNSLQQKTDRLAALSIEEKEEVVQRLTTLSEGLSGLKNPTPEQIKEGIAKMKDAIKTNQYLDFMLGIR